MKNVTVTIVVALCLAITAAAGFARDAANRSNRIQPRSSFQEEVPDFVKGVQPGLQRAEAAGTTWYGVWDFDSGATCLPEGWVTADLTAQLGEYWHVDDFAGLGGGSYGLLVPLEGTKSMWCGLRPDPEHEIYKCYYSLPGYGPNWSQQFCSTCLTVSGDVKLAYLISWDSEPGYDATAVEYDVCGSTEAWVPIPSAWNSGNADVYDGSGSLPDSVLVEAANHSGSIRFRFNFTSDGAWCDADGYWDTDGAVIVDALRVTDGTGEKSYEDFEGATVGDKSAGDWAICNMPPFGDFAALYPGIQMVQEDPCRQNLTCMWTFFTGSTETYACGGFPAQLAVPKGNDRGQYFHNQIWSPVLPFTGTGSIVEIDFDVYRDLPLDNLVFYEWYVRSWFDDCPGAWVNRYDVWFGITGDWFPENFSVGDVVEPGATSIQVALGAWDLCFYWCGVVGSGLCHSHAPLIDNVSIYRVATAGPQWHAGDYSVFQDNFSADGTITGTVRADCGEDILPRESPGIQAGDSATVTITDPQYGLAADAYTGFGPAAYCYVKVDPPQPAKSGVLLSDDPFRWPVVDSVLAPDGDMWYMVRFDTAFTTDDRTTPAANEYCVDLHDNLFTPGDTVWFFFSAESADPAGTVVYYFHTPIASDSRGVGAVFTTSDIAKAMNNASEFTCLPAAGGQPGADILYVDDFSGRGGQPYFDTAFQFLGIYDKVDRYDIRGPDSNVGNGLSSRVTNVQQQLIPIYRKILWHSGDLTDGIIGDGIAANEKTDDFTLLYSFLDQSDNNPGLWISGDNAAYEWSTLVTASPIQLKGAYMNFNVSTGSHTVVGLPVSPKVIGVAGSVFDNPTGPDTLVAYGGCALINDFDVLQQSGSSVVAATYDGNSSWAAILTQQTENAAGSTASVMLEGFAYNYIRDDRPAGVPDRVDHLKAVLAFLGNSTEEPTGADPMAYEYSLSQNYPNPFNPTTTIRYTVRDRAQVTLRVYNVAGQLIRTLVNESRSPGEVHTATWDGRNDAGETVSSGVYFYKLVAGDYVQTKKMVLLK